MKIGFFADAYKPTINGVVKSMASFKKGLEDMGHEVYVFAPKRPKFKDKEKNVFRIGSIKLPSNSDYRMCLPLFNSSIKVIKDLDVIHAHHPFMIGRYAYFFAEFYNKPLVFTHHTQYERYCHYVPFEQHITKMMALWLVKEFANNCDCVIAPSKSIRSLIKKRGIKSRIEVVPTGIDLNMFKKADPKMLRNRYKIPKEKKILLYLGRLAKEKNVELVIDAFKIVKEKMPDTCLFIAGSGDEEEFLKKRAAENNVSGDVFFCGKIRNVFDFYSSADLFVFGSSSGFDL